MAYPVSPSARQLMVDLQLACIEGLHLLDYSTLDNRKNPLFHPGSDLEIIPMLCILTCILWAYSTGIMPFTHRSFPRAFLH